MFKHPFVDRSIWKSEETARRCVTYLEFLLSQYLALLLRGYLCYHAWWIFAVIFAVALVALEAFFLTRLFLADPSELKTVSN